MTRSEMIRDLIFNETSTDPNGWNVVGYVKIKNYRYPESGLDVLPVDASEEEIMSSTKPVQQVDESTAIIVYTQGRTPPEYVLAITQVGNNIIAGPGEDLIGHIQGWAEENALEVVADPEGILDIDEDVDTKALGFYGEFFRDVYDQPWN